ncbi:MAG: hypothetical protein JXB40_05880 [Candidatus Omnitrophica bacterium]|nr:hypothetical protein [Candidatus Omnitrophota bacterium]
MNIAKLFLAACLIAAAAMPSGEYCRAEVINKEDIDIISGTITAVDTFKHTFTVKWRSSDMIHFNYTTFKAPQGMNFYKGTEMISIFELNIGSSVTIAYYIDKSGELIVARMDVGR